MDSRRIMPRFGVVLRSVLACSSGETRARRSASEFHYPSGSRACRVVLWLRSVHGDVDGVTAATDRPTARCRPSVCRVSDWSFFDSVTQSLAREMTSDTTHAAPELSAEEQADDGTTAAPPARPATGRFPRADSVRLRATEREILRTRVALLERQVARKERELNAVIDRYEELLAAENPRTHVDDGAVEIEFESDETEPGVGVRLRDALSRLF